MLTNIQGDHRAFENRCYKYSFTTRAKKLKISTTKIQNFLIRMFAKNLTVIVSKWIKSFMFNRKNCSLSKNLHFTKNRFLMFETPDLPTYSSYRKDPLL